ncbi:TPA: hypothetical protein TX976_000529 [Streptococcus suis]|nr:hypothetical protein [Streptococcus suis]
MEISDIIDSYDGYLLVYNGELSKLEGTARTLLENSLYLSIFTTFELFLKEIIDIYLNKKVEAGMTFNGLVDDFASEYLKNRERQFNNFFDTTKKDDRIKSFSNIKEQLNGKIVKEELRNYIRFEFLHKKKLKEYYPSLFEQILGDKDFLSGISLQFTSDMFHNLENRIEQNAQDFLSVYTEKIRNSIAHENSKFYIETDSFVECVDHFKKITQKIYDKFVEHNDFTDLQIRTRENQMDLL